MAVLDEVNNMGHLDAFVQEIVSFKIVISLLVLSQEQWLLFSEGGILEQELQLLERLDVDLEVLGVMLSVLLLNLESHRGRVVFSFKDIRFLNFIVLFQLCLNLSWFQLQETAESPEYLSRQQVLKDE